MISNEIYDSLPHRGGAWFKVVRRLVAPAHAQSKTELSSCTADRLGASVLCHCSVSLSHLPPSNAMSYT